MDVPTLLSAVALVAAHALVLLGHDFAHGDLGVVLSTWQSAFAYSVIVATPVLAAVLLFTRRRSLGFGLLAASMLGALCFGVYHHYVLVSPDHVSHLPPGGSRGLFRGTAAAMALLELAGVAVGVRGAIGSRDAAARPAAPPTAPSP